MLLATTAQRLDGGGEIIHPSDATAQVAPYPSKRWLEFHQLQYFKKCIKKTYPHLQWSLLGDGRDPPDYQITRGQGPIGLEVTAFTSGSRLAQLKFFDQIQSQFLDSFRNGALRRLTGLRIQLSFGEFGGRLEKIDEETFKGLVKDLERVSRKPRMPLSQFSAIKPTPLLSESGRQGNVEWRITSVRSHPVTGTQFADETGFQLSYSIADWIQSETVLEQLQQRIDKKDVAGNDELLISAGSPSVNGWILSADIGTLLAAIQHWQGVTHQPKYLQRVFLNLWGVDKVYILYDRNEKYGDSTNKNQLLKIPNE